MTRRSLRLFLTAAAVTLAVFSGVSTAAATVGWTVHAVSEPTSFGAGDKAACEVHLRKCDRYQLLVQNNGDEAAKGPVTVTDTFPPGITFVESYSGYYHDEVEWSCVPGPGGASVKCTYEPLVPAGKYAPNFELHVTAPTVAMQEEYAATKAPLQNTVRVEGGGAAPSTSVQDTPLNQPEGFALRELAFAPQSPGGAPALTPGGHPWSLTTTFRVPVLRATPKAEYPFQATRNIRSASVELPAGFLGDPLAAGHCTETQLREFRCPPDSQIGLFALLNPATGGPNEGGIWEETGLEKSGAPPSCCSAIYNMVPDAGYPAQFGFVYFGAIPVSLYADVVHTATGYRTRVTVPGLSEYREVAGSTVTFFGEPGARALHEGEPSFKPSEAAFLTNPSDCAAEEEGLSGKIPSSGGEPVTARDFATRIELEPWAEPGPEHVIHAESTAYPSVSGCAALAGLFTPKLQAHPSEAGPDPSTQEGSSQADEPSAYTVDLKLAQTSGYSEAATPDVRDATVVMPAGVTVNPSAATGLSACQATGPQGINVGSSEIGPGGQDLGDPEATELGAGYEGGNGSPYDDGFYHTAPGKCPGASILGSVEVNTPLLEKPLQGHIFLGQPECGGPGQEACNDAYAEGKGGPSGTGRLFQGYIEVAGSGVIIKLPGTISANPSSGQLTGSFKENPQFPFTDFKLHFHGGPRAPVANPQSCGSFQTSSTLTSWAGQSVSEASEPFSISGCTGSTPPFAPSFTAGTTNTQAGAYTPFVLSFSRQDREQDLAGLTETMPPGLVGKIAGIEQCPEAQANAGTCSSASEIGTTTATAGPGPEPFQVTGGHVYLTGPYHGAPFGLSIVVPTKAGPFDLGDEVIRAQINIDPNTAQVTVSTNPLPQKKDGVPFRLRSVTTAVSRPGFTLNPTSCAGSSVTGAITGSQGAVANVSTPFNVTGCAALPFHPGYSISTSAKTSKTNGASLTVKVSQRPGEANIHKVDLTIPKILPSRLTTINKACLAATFEVNPASCSEGSIIGTAVAHTPLLSSPLIGPAYLVSHGGAAFPDVEYVLQGEGVVIVLDGATDIKKGITYSRFETVPDAPISSFETTLGEGPHSILTTEKPGVTNLCAPTSSKTETVKTQVTVKLHGKKKKVTRKVKKTVTAPLSLTIPTVITGQNGAVVNENTPVTTTGCAKATVKKAKPKAKGKAKKTKKKAKQASGASDRGGDGRRA